MVRDTRKLNDDLRGLLQRGDIGIAGRELVDLAVVAAVIGNAVNLPPRGQGRYVTDAYARELEFRLAALDEAVREALLLPTA